ncbi:MAG: hypothetical protein GY953_41730 [bacterium]|nr:hypothetical protein [bacterium]
MFSASVKKPVIVDVGKLKYITYDGEGHPDGNEDFQRAFEALYSVAYTIKFTLKMGPDGRDFKVMPPEGLWWIEGGQPFDKAPKSAWRWRLMIAVPDYVDGAMLRAARKGIKEKKGLTSPENVRLKPFREGKAVQLMHIGPYDQEKPTIDRMMEFAAEGGYRVAGKHHEIYISDPRRTAPEKLKTILRLPVKRA